MDLRNWRPFFKVLVSGYFLVYELDSVFPSHVNPQANCVTFNCLFPTCPLDIRRGGDILRFDGGARNYATSRVGNSAGYHATICLAMRQWKRHKWRSVVSSWGTSRRLGALCGQFGRGW